MGPWYHVTTGQGVDLNAIELRWFDRWLKLEHTGIAQIKTPLHVYELGAGHYLDTTRYPFTGATPTTYFLGPAGTLARTRPDRAGGADTLVWTGLSSFCSGSTEQWGAGFGELIATSLGSHDPCASDDRAIQTGPGAATYTTAPFTEPTLLAGPIDATLYASSTTRDAEWVVTVEDVSPSGASKPLSSGALLGSLRATDRALTWTASDGRPLLPFHPYTKESVAPLTPGQLTRFDVEVFPTFASLAPGHRLRVTVSTADTPHLTPLPAQIANLIGGVYRLSHSADAASFVELPLAPASAFTTACGLCG
jgi:putative CocE/NonD family hydrolase